MGTGYTLCCRKCGYEISANLGVGFFFPSVHQRTMEAARAGKLGKRVQQFLQEHPDGSLNTETVFLQCEECGTLKCGPDLSMYIRNPDVSRGERGRWSAAAPFEETDYVSPMELDRENTYTMYAPGHICRKCRKPLKSVSQDDLSRAERDFMGTRDGRTEVFCPKCREPLWIESISMWD